MPLCAGVVSFSSRLVAGMRAYESKEEDSLFKDPLAEVLSGKRGMDEAKLTLKVKTLAALQLCSGHIGGHE
jgi:O-methyltransferase involved in polyketide biosynthesis